MSTTTSDRLDRVYVWVWRPGAEEPVPAGVIERNGPTFDFAYGRSYLAREDAVALFLPELPLNNGRQRPPAGLPIAGCLRDAAPMRGVSG